MLLRGDKDFCCCRCGCRRQRIVREHFHEVFGDKTFHCIRCDSWWRRFCYTIQGALWRCVLIRLFNAVNVVFGDKDFSKKSGSTMTTCLQTNRLSLLSMWLLFTKIFGVSSSTVTKFRMCWVDVLPGLKLLSANNANQCDGSESAILCVDNAEETMGGLENLLDVDLHHCYHWRETQNEDLQDFNWFLRESKSHLHTQPVSSPE